MIKVVYIVIFLTLPAMWLYSRSCLWRHIVAPSKGESRSMFLWDFLYWGFFLASISYRYWPTPWWNSPIGASLGRMTYLFIGLVWLICVWGLFLDLLYWLVNKAHKKEVKENPDFNPSRRLLPQKALAYGGLGVVSGASLLGVYQGIFPKVYEVDIPLGEKFPGLRGMSITQLSDIHIGPSLKGDFLKRVVKKANALQSDLIVITGDLVDGLVSQLKDEMSPLKDLQAPMGVYYVTGNHEYYWGAKEWVEFVRSCQITPLMNSHRKLSYKGTPFYLAGVTDLRANRFLVEHASNPRGAFPSEAQDICKIMLAHRPKSCYEVVGTGTHLQLSGHTHGGQGIPWKFLVKVVQPFLAGLYHYKGMWLYVNRGTGFWGPPVRAGIQGEITKLTIV